MQFVNTVDILDANQHILKGNLGAKQTSYASLAESRFYQSSDKRDLSTKRGANNGRSRNDGIGNDGVASATSLWTPDDDMGNKM